MSKGNVQGPFAKLAKLRDALPAGPAPGLTAQGSTDGKDVRRGTIATILERRANADERRANADERRANASSGASAKPGRAKVAPAQAEADEAAVFLAEMTGVSRLGAPRRARVDRAAEPPKAKVTSDDAEVLAELADLCDDGGTFDWADTDEHIEGIAEGLDRRLLKRLRAGDFAIQGHVDLHGLTRAEAKDRVQKFLEDSRRAGHRTVLVVHGRGLHSKDHVPVLKQALKQWLERGPIARGVLAFTTARPADGGAGAVVLLLRSPTSTARRGDRG